MKDNISAQDKKSHIFFGKTLDNSGFSLVELVVVIAILIVLLSQLIPAVYGYIRKAQKMKDVANARAVAMAMQTLIATDTRVRDEVLKANTGSNGHTSGDYGARYALTEDLVTVAYCKGAKLNTDGTIEYWGSDDLNYGNRSSTAFKIANNDRQTEKAYVELELWKMLDYKDLELAYQNDRMKIDRFIICAPENSTEISVWAGRKEGKATPYYQLYPDPDLYLAS